MKAFVYSLDGFVALLIALVTVQLLLATISAMTFREPIALQAKLLSADIVSIARELSLRGKDFSCISLDAVMPSKYGYKVSLLDRECLREQPYGMVKIGSSMVSAVFTQYEKPEARPPACTLYNLQEVVIDPGNITVEKIGAEVWI